MKKIADTYFFFVFLLGLCPLPELRPFEKHLDEVFSAKYLKKTIEARALKFKE